ncbi:MAG: response regulator [Anaerolineaceae bacterium]|nr:response regulator [Anaerolineaceae bacterium]
MKSQETDELHYSVLIVEDSHEAGKYLKTALETMDVPFQVTLLPSAEEVILCLADAKFDLLIIDIQLPGMDGVKLVKKIRTKDRKSKIIMQTGIKDADVIASLDTIQIDGFIQKPFKVGQIVDSVRTALGLKPPSDEDPLEEFPDVEEAKFENPEQVESTLQDMIQRLGARETCVIDSKGKILFQVTLSSESDLTDNMLHSLVRARTAAKEIQQYVETDSPRNVFVLRGKGKDILFATIFQFTLVLILNTGATALKVSLAFEELIRIQDAFTRELYRQPIEIFDELPQKAKKSEPVSKKEKKKTELGPEIPDSIPQISDETFEKVLNSSIQKITIPEDNLDNFWESAADSRFNDLSGRNLTFDEAKERGINSIE